MPIGGSCTISPLTGINSDTVFTIECSNFTDPGGNIEKYEYYCMKPTFYV